MLVYTFATDVTLLGTIEYPITTTHIYFTTYYPLSARQWVTCQAEFLTLPSAFHQRVHTFIAHFVSSNCDSHVMLVSTFATDVIHLRTIGYPTTTTNIYFSPYYPLSARKWIACQSEFLTLP